MLGSRVALRAVGAMGALSALACAKIEPPPGGPPDAKPPVLVSITPESLSVNPGFDGNVNFIFSEVVSEGGTPSQGYGTGDLEKLILLSPTNKVPVVRWHRSRISVRPREGWVPDRVYRVQLLPGISDIRNNKGVKGGIVTFTTGAPVPDYTLSGTAYDWTASQPMRGGLIEAVLEPDSLVYKSLTDSTGSFVFGPLPRGTYLVYVGLDQNRNGRIDPREAYDSVRVEPDSGKVPELFAFIHDTTPPRLTPPTTQDSTTINLTFTQKLDPYATYDSNAVSVLLLPDSVPVPVLRVMTAAQFDSVSKSGRMRADSVQKERMDSLARADTTKRAKPDSVAKKVPGVPPVGPGAIAPKPPDTLSRPPLSDRLIVQLGAPLQPGTKYLVETHDVKNVTGVEGSPKAGFEVPKRPKPTPADSARVLRTQIDSALATGDSTAADSLKLLLPVDSLLQPPGGAPKNAPPPEKK